MAKPFLSIVTGGCGGIGKAIVFDLVSRGDTVIIFDIFPFNSSQIGSFQEQLEERGISFSFVEKEGECNLQASVYYLQVDIRNSLVVEQAFSTVQLLAEKLKLPLRLLVNNAGVTQDGLAIRLAEDRWDFVVDVNLKGAFLCSREAIRLMLPQRSGYIINISSVVALTGNFGQVNYSASKAGLLGLTKSLAIEYGGKNILVNAILPGFIKTAMTENLHSSLKDKIMSRIILKRFGDPQDVANLVSFLSSGKANYITGQYFVLDGGIF